MKIKVKELMDKLSELDKEKYIHIVYDCFYEIPFDIEIADDNCYCKSVETGDYIINVC